MLHAWDVDLFIDDLLCDLGRLARFCVGLSLLNSCLDSHCLGPYGVIEATELVRKDKVQLTILFELVSRKPDLLVPQVSDEGHSSGQIQHVSGVVPPCLFVEPIIKVLVHVLLAIFVPWFLVVVEVPFVNLWDL